jgi:hypothetical protein
MRPTALPNGASSRKVKVGDQFGVILIDSNLEHLTMS